MRSRPEVANIHHTVRGLPALATSALEAAAQAVFFLLTGRTEIRIIRAVFAGNRASKALGALV